MNYRAKELMELNLEGRWLDAVHAENAYEYASQFSSKEKYGLSTETVSNIEHHDIESDSVANVWLKDRLDSSGTVQVVYSESEVVVMPTKQFVNNWQNIFLPARDDAIILHNLNNSVVFYCHEEELEFGERNA